MSIDLTFQDPVDAQARLRYTTRRLADLARCRESLERRDFETIENIGHNLKGNGISFGFPELSQLGASMEISARESDDDQVALLVDRFAEWVHKQGC